MQWASVEHGKNCRAYIEEGMNHEIHEIHERGNDRTTNGHEWTTNIFLKESREERVEGSAWLARLGVPARQFRRALPEVEMNHEWDK